ncbi:MAG: transketolase [Thermodesulfobacteriota bacterium]
MTHAGQRIDELCINTLRMLSADMVEQAKSGHPGLPMGAATMAYVLWTRFLKHNPADPLWPDRDRFVLSAGHGSALLYSLLHLTGYALTMDDIKAFRQWESKTPGHPEYGVTPGVEATTGPLGQGVGMATGMALAQRFLAQRFNRPYFPVCDHFTYALISDGDLMEGVASEAASLAGHLRLGRLICLYDDNRISIDGPTSLSFTEDVAARFRGYGWHVQKVGDGNDVTLLTRAIAAAREEPDRPSLVMVRTHIGFGSPKQDTAGAHGEPLGEKALAAARKNLNWTYGPFQVPDEAVAHFRAAVEQGAEKERQWHTLLADYAEAHGELADEFRRWCVKGELPQDWDADIPSFEGEKPMATRSASGKVLNAIARRVPNLLGGSADLSPSNKTEIAGSPDQSWACPQGRNLRFGVREHAMGAVVNGLALHGGVIPYGGTFLIFSDYMRPSVRLSALMQVHSIFVFTHDGIAVGEDGPTHQPVEHLASLRAIPNLTVIRPADAKETAQAWKVALQSKGPVVLALTRQNVPTLPGVPTDAVSRGAYVLSDVDGGPDMLLLATGSEVSLALDAQKQLAERNIRARVVSMPSWELFLEQPEEYRNRVLPKDVKVRVAVEAGCSFGWRRWVGDAGDVVSVERFGASAPGKLVMERYGFTVENVIAKCLVCLRNTE